MDLQPHQFETRRRFFQRSALGLGAAALSTLLGDDAANAAPSTTVGGLAGLPHHPPRAKRAIYLFMAGAPSQLDLYD